MSEFVDCKRLNCEKNKWSLFPGFHCILKVTHLNEKGCCTDYIKQVGKIDAYKEALEKGRQYEQKSKT
ncbi:MAG: hypothetical protein PHS34_09000 [Candidatus Omnitrophica bacterium]|nr:hypothetical protein [Candidatus Omnitrophota bacterium]